MHGRQAALALGIGACDIEAKEDPAQPQYLALGTASARRTWRLGVGAISLARFSAHGKRRRGGGNASRPWRSSASITVPAARRALGRVWVPVPGC